MNAVLFILQFGRCVVPAPLISTLAPLNGLSSKSANKRNPNRVHVANDYQNPERVETWSGTLDMK
jgi:hypothetical protein